MFQHYHQYCPPCPPVVPAPCPSRLELQVVGAHIVVIYEPTYLPSRMATLDWPGGPLIEFALPASGQPIAPVLPGTYTLTIPCCSLVATIIAPAIPCATTCPADVNMFREGTADLRISLTGPFTPFYVRFQHPDGHEEVILINANDQILVAPLEAGTYVLSPEAGSCGFPVRQETVPTHNNLSFATYDFSDHPRLYANFNGGTGFGLIYNDNSGISSGVVAKKLTQQVSE
jgi:hypothetical protein